MTPSEYDYLCALLKRRSGLTLTNDKQYLIESRLRPIIQKGGLSSIEGAHSEGEERRRGPDG